MPRLFARRLVFKHIVAVLLMVTCVAGEAQVCEWLNAASETGEQTGRLIDVDDSNNVIVAGTFTDPFTIGTQKLTATYSLFVAKYDLNGSPLWAKQFICSTQTATLDHITTDRFGNIFVIGESIYNVDFGNNIKLVTYGMRNTFVVKLDPNGKALWLRMIYFNLPPPPPPPPSTTPVRYKDILTLVADYQGNLIVGLSYYDHISFSHGSTASMINSNGKMSNFGLVKYDPGGTIVASQYYGGGSIDVGFNIDCDSAGNIYAAGFTWGAFYLDSISTLLPADASFIIKFSPDLIPVAANAAPYSANSRIFGLSVDKGGDFVITGFVDQYGPLDFGNLVINHSGPAPFNTFVVYFRDMQPVWGTRITSTVNGGTMPEPANEIIIASFPSGPPSVAWTRGRNYVDMANGKIYIAGKLLAGDSYFGDTTLTATSNGEGYITRMDTSGKFIWAHKAPKGGTIYSLAADSFGSCYLTGGYTNEVSLLGLYAGGQQEDLFVAKITDYAIYRGVVKDTNYCSGDSIIIPYDKYGHYNPGNRFIVQLSDTSGKFTGNIIELGSVTDTLSGVIRGKIPLYGIPTSSKYRLRIVSTDPVVHSYYTSDALRLKIFSKDTANAGPDIHLCYGQSVTLGTTGGSYWRWNPFKYMSRRADTLNRQPTIIKPTADVEYRIIISDPISGCGPTDTDYVKIYVRPKLELVGNDTFYYCKGREVTMTAKAAGGDSLNYSFQWGKYNDPKKEVLSTDSFFTIAPPGLYRYILIVKDGCSDPDSLIVTTIPLPGLTLTLPTDTTICPGSTINLEPTSYSCDSSSVRYDWDNGLGTGRVKAVSPTVKTTYRVIACDTLDLTAKDTAYITVSLSPPLDITVNKDTTICKGNAVQLKSNPAGGIPTLHQVIWQADNSTWTDTAVAVNVTTPVTTKYTAILKDGCSAPDSAAVTVTVLPEINITLNPDTTICKGRSTQLKATVTGGVPSQYKLNWLLHDSGLPVDTNFTLTVTPDTNTTYLAVVTDNCTVLPDSSRVKVNVRPPLDIAVNSDTTICTAEKAEIRVNAKGGLPSQYSLKWNDGTNTWTDNNFVAQVNPGLTTNYTVILEDNCTVKPDTASISVTVRPPLKVTVSAKDSVCEGKSVNLKATISGGLPSKYNFQWTNDNGPWTSTSNPVKHTPGFSTTYKATLTDNCSPDVADSVFVNVLPIPLADFTVSDSVGCPPMHLTLNDASLDNEPAYNQWILPGTVITGGTYAKQTFTDPGKYDVGLIVYNDLGCSDTLYRKGIEVYIKPEANFIIKPNIKETEEKIVLVNLSKRAVKYVWSLGNYDSIYQYNLRDTTYTYLDSGDVLVKLIAENSFGCRDTASELIRVVDKLNCYVPDAFSPNSDFINDVFGPSCIGLKEYRLQVYNRWGQMIHDCNCPWDGKHQGEIVPEGAYVYIIQTTSESGKKKAFKGVVLVIM